MSIFADIWNSNWQKQKIFTNISLLFSTCPEANLSQVLLSPNNVFTCLGQVGKSLMSRPITETYLQ